MIEFAHQLTMWFENGTASAVYATLAECWEAAGIMRMEHTFHLPDAGEWIGSRCIPTQTLTQVPVPEIRPWP